MLIVPYKGGDRALLRASWATFALVAVNVVFYLAFCVGPSDRDRAELMHSWRSAVTYLQERPYLYVPPTIAGIMPRDLRTRVPKPNASVPDWRASQEQNTVNEMARDLAQRHRDVADMRMAFIPAIADPVTVLTSMFLHGGLLHLFGNMLFLLAAGPFVEEAYGHPLFLALYITGGIAATLGFAAMHPSSMQPLVGASGAIAAIMGAYLFRFALSEIDFLFIPIAFLPFWNYRFSMRAIVALPIWLLEQVVSIPMEGDSGVAVTAHIAGFAYGFVVVLLLRVLRFEKRLQPVAAPPPDTRYDRALAAFHRQDVASARRELIPLLAEQPSNRDALRLAVDIASSDDDALVADPHFLAQAAAFAERTGDRPRAIALLERLCDSEPPAVTVIPSLVKLAMLRRSKGDKSGAQQALSRALGHPECSSEWRRKIETTMSMI